MKILWLNRKRLIILGVISVIGLIGGVYLGFIGHGIAVGIKNALGIATFLRGDSVAPDPTLPYFILPDATLPLMPFIVKFGLFGLLIPTGIALLIFYLKFLWKNYKHH